MIKTARFRLLKDNQPEIDEQIKLINNKHNYIFKIAGFKMTLNDRYFERENEEFKIHISIIEKRCLLHLKKHNLEYEINVDKIEFINNNNKIQLIYKLESDEKENKLLIEQGE